MCTRPGTRLHARLFKRSGERGSERCKGKKLFVPDCAYVVIISNGSREFTVRRRIGFGVVSENSVSLVNSSWIEDEFCPIFPPREGIREKTRNPFDGTVRKKSARVGGVGESSFRGRGSAGSPSFITLHIGATPFDDRYPEPSALRIFIGESRRSVVFFSRRRDKSREKKHAGQRKSISLIDKSYTRSLE